MKAKDLTPHQRAALNFRDHISLTANAGSGKTLVLAKRFVDIALSSPEISLRNIVAITFTEKAAGELYNKIVSETEERLLLGPPPADRMRLERIRRELVSANISTIHSFCIDILRSYPAEAGIDASFTPMDQAAADDLTRLSIEETLKKLLGDKSYQRSVRSLIRIFGSSSLFASTLASMVTKRRVLLSLISDVYSKSTDEIAEFLDEAFLNTLSLIIQDGLDETIQAVRNVNEAVISSDSSAGAASRNKRSAAAAPANPTAMKTELLLNELENHAAPEERLRTLSDIKSMLITHGGTLRKQGYLKAAAREQFAGDISRIEKYFSAELFDYALPEDRMAQNRQLAVFGKQLSEAFSEVMAVYDSKKLAHGYLDFEDILLYTQRILTLEEVRRGLGERYRYIMVDEYQDTNELQYEIFMPILDYLKTGNLFVVGDEKQSIYMFRDAEPEVFDQTRRDISEVSGIKSLLTLPDSFRMSPEICAFTNHLFSELFREPKALYNEVKYTPLVCAAQNMEEGQGRIQIILLPKDRTSSAGMGEYTGSAESHQSAESHESAEGHESAESHGSADVKAASGHSEAMAVASSITELYESGKAGLDGIAVLCRKRRSFDEIERAFLQLNIPYTIAGGKGFYQRQIVYDIYNYLSFLINRSNDASLLAVLRSPFYYLSDAEIYDISLETGDTLWEKLLSFRSAGERSDEVNRAADDLEVHYHLTGSLSLMQLIRRIFRDSRYLTVLASRPNGSQEIANLEKLISVAMNFSSFGLRTVYDFTSYLYDSIRQVEDEGQASALARENTVKIMTIHQAKGLEFDAVFLYACDDYTAAGTVKARSVTVTRDFGILTSLPLGDNYFEDYLPAPAVVLNNHIMRKKNLAEIKRLLYVGITRAKKYLFISARHSDYRFPANSFLSLISEVLGLKDRMDMIRIDTSLDFLKKDNDGYYNENKQVTLNIQVSDHYSIPEPMKYYSRKDTENKYKLYTSPVEDTQKDEVISATQFVTYTDCPRRYRLLYQLGMKHLIEKYIEIPEGRMLPLIKGRVVHRVLQLGCTLTEAEELLDKLIVQQASAGELAGIDRELLKEDILAELKSFYASDVYAEISSYADNRSEFEVYAREDDFFMHGILDRVLFTKDKAVIVDYKTDSLEGRDVSEAVKQHLNQLKFYAYLISRLKEKERPEIEIMLVFTKHPEMSYRSVIEDSALKEIKQAVAAAVNSIRSSYFPENPSACSHCPFHLNGQCLSF